MAHATRWLLPALLAIGVGTQGAAGSQLLASGTATARASQEPTELVLIGTLHADHLLNPAYSPTHFRALLDRISPNAVGIERLPDWRQRPVDPFGVAAYLPESEVALSWGREHGVPVEGVSWWDDPPPAQIEAMRSNIRRYLARSPEQREAGFERQFRNQVLYDARKAYGEPYVVTFGPADQRMTDVEAPVDYSVGYVHGEGVVTSDRSLREQLSEAQWATMGQRDDRIAERILELARRYPGGRIAVIHGESHYMPLVRRFTGHSEVRVVPTTEFLPLNDAELAASWHPDDAIVLLGVNLDSTVARAAPHARDHHRTKIELERLTATEPETAAALYYLARWRMLFGDFNGAEPLLQRVQQIPDEEPVGFPAHSQWRWPPFSDFAAMATFALGTLNDLRGDHEAAVVLYRELLEALTPETARVYQGVGIYVDLGVYLESLIAEPYTGGPREVLRQIEAQRAVE